MSQALAGDVVLSVEQARECVQQIRETAAQTWEWVTRAYLGRAWLALGYASWDAMCDGELGGMRLRLPRETRRDAVASLRESGMSTRAIGSALGVSDHTVRQDAGARNHAPVTGRDGKTYTPPQRSREVPDEQITDLVNKIVSRDREKIEADRIRRRADIVRRFFEAVAILAEMPPAEHVAAMIPAEQRPDAARAHQALNWLTDMTKVLDTQVG